MAIPHVPIGAGLGHIQLQIAGHVCSVDQYARADRMGRIGQAAHGHNDTGGRKDVIEDDKPLFGHAEPRGEWGHNIVLMAHGERKVRRSPVMHPYAPRHSGRL